MSNNATVADVLRDSLIHDPRIPDPSEVDVEVRDGWVTLKGEVAHQFESDAAYDDLAGLHGVLGITNEIRVTTMLGLHRHTATNDN